MLIMKVIMVVMMMMMMMMIIMMVLMVTDGCGNVGDNDNGMVMVDSEDVNVKDCTIIF